MEPSDGVPERERERAVADLGAGSLPASVERLVGRYDRIIPERGRYVWDWLADTLPTFRLGSVVPEHEARADEARLLVSVFVTTLNDLSDRREDDDAFETAALIPQGEFDAATAADPAVELAADAWDALLDRLEGAPRFDTHLATLRRDLAWTVRAQRHAAWSARRPAETTYEECLQEQAPTMCMDALATVDLMCSPTFDPTEERAVREAVALVEPLGRIGNWLTTWERELEEGDLANGIVVKGVEDGVVSPEAVRRASAEPTVRPAFRRRIREAGVELAVEEDWRRRYERALGHEWETGTVDLDSFVAAMDDVRRRHDASRGKK
ncbi:hypothetical protein [Halorarum halobium]|uniref:hypothetical protein n=1 Tax=Halorarum halobium TaxID=3075121 RepID=UPI0028AF7B31|nr:hypothetical protein [Halobaculum sp. XH14]